MKKTKIACVGNFACGKTSLLVRIVRNEFSGDLQSTLGIDMIEYKHESGKDVLFADTAGEERFKSMTSSFYRNNAAVLLCYDSTNAKSFEDVRGFFEECNRFNPDSIKFLIACKSDLAGERVVDPVSAREFQENQSIDGFFETSSKTGDGVKAMVDELISLLAEKDKSKAPANTEIVRVEQVQPQKEKKSCTIL